MYDDAQRIELAIKSGGRMLGPVERERCTRHKRRWILWRWTWPCPATDEGETHLDCLENSSEQECVRGCGACAAEERAREMDGYDD